MRIEPYEPEPLPEARQDVPMNVASRIISRDRFCLGCGRNVRGLRIDEPCPDCGLPILGNQTALPGAPALGAIVADTDTISRCAGCGYDLRGLPYGGVCPECGLPKSMPAGASMIDPLSRMPIETIRYFRNAALAVSLTMVVGIAVLVRAMLGAGPPIVTAIMLLVVSGAWAVAVRLATPAMTEGPAVARGFSSAGRLRIVTQLLQLGWIIAAVCTLILAALPTPSAVPEIVFFLVRWVGVALGLAGLWCFAILMGRLAEWTRDDFAERVFNLALWGIPLGTPPLLYFNIGAVLGLSYVAVMMRGPVMILVFVLWLAWLVALLVFPLAMLSLTKSVVLSVMHHREHQDRQRRQMKRLIEYDERLSDAIGKMDGPARP